MLSFKTWFEQVILENEQPLRRDQQEKVKHLYDRVLDALDIGGAGDQTHSSLSDITDDDAGGPGNPPVMRGAQVAKDKLEKSGIFQQIEKLGIPSLTQRAHDVQTYLGKIANDQEVGPTDTVGQLLNKLFGNNAVQLYSKDLYKSSPPSTSHAPEDNAPPPQDATAPPMSANQPPPDGSQPAMGEPPGGMPPMGGMQPPPMGQPGTMPPPMGQPGMPLQSPGGPFPQMPPAMPGQPPMF